MGGEKLKISRPVRGVFFAVLLIACFFGNAFSLFAQESFAQESFAQNQEPPLDESSIILGETAVTQAPNSGSSIGVVIRMVLVLALAALAIYGVVFFIKRLSKPQEVRDPHLKVLARIPLSSDTFAAVIALGANAWLVAGGSGGINLISDISESESLEAMLIDDANKIAEAASPRILDFRALLGKLGGQSGGGQASHAEKLRKKRERLKGL